MPPADTPAAGAPLSIEEQTGMLTDGDGRISPATFPVPTPSPGYIETLASRLRTSGGAISGIGHDIDASWGGLTGCYTAPEAGELYTVLNPVAADGDTVSEGLNGTASALEDFADALSGIKSRWETLRGEAHEFRNRIDAEGDEWREAEGIKGFFGIGESPDVAENQGYVDRGLALIEEYAEAERSCANRINAGIPDRTRFAAMPESGELDPDVFYHGYDQDLSDLATAWGMEVAATDEHWWVDVGAAVGDWVVGAVEGLGAMVGAHSSEGWFEMSWGDAMVEQWESSAQSVASLVGMYDAESDDWGWSGWGTVGSAWRDAAHAVVPWEEWGERPGYVIGTAVLNIGVTALGAALSATGVGAAVGVPLMAWRGAAIISRMGDSRVPDVDLPDMDSPGISVNLNLPNFVGGSRELFRIDTSSFDLGGLSRERLAEAQGAVERLTARFGAGGAESADSPHHRRAAPEDPTAQDLADVVTVQDVLDPTSPEAARLREQYEGDFLENDVRSDGTPGSWEASPHSDTDGPEADGARVPAGVGGRGDDTLTATGDIPGPAAERRVDLTGIGMSDDLPGTQHDGDVNLRDRAPDVTNSAADDKGPDSPPGDSNASDHADGGEGIQGAPDTHSGARRTTNIGGGLNVRGNSGGDGGGDGGDTPLSAQTVDPGNPDHRDLVPDKGRRFGDGVQLDPDTRYTLLEHGSDLRTEYITDSQGKIREVRASSDGWNSEHPEFMNPRPDMTYVVDGSYTYRTDSLGRTESVEGTLRSGTNVRNEGEQNWVNSQGRIYFEELNKQLREEFGPGEAPQYQNIQWDGGHLIGYAEFFGIGERLNQVPMRFDVNQNRTETALPDIPEEARGGIDGSFRNLERSWRGIMQQKDKWHGFSDPRFNDGSWDAALALNPTNPQIDVRISNIYDPNLPSVPHPSDPDRMIPPPPSKIIVEWELNGVPMRVQRYMNLPPLTNTEE
ncbi:hypothetical protein ACIBFB_14665 [Nocardiopsis sp. NPDC050513]|uniref:hypothetical protein n=1 Tax=Nocardiopsis sp. NPDC050513 TaxID=3364338 RepID=UPI00378AD838